MSELISNFGIDWKLLLAQVVNFFILVIILRKFAYKPIIQMLSKRKQEIEKGLNFTKQAQEKLGRIEDERQDVLKEAKSEALGIVAKAETLSKERGEEIIKSASRRSDDIIIEAKKAIEEEKSKMGEEVYLGAESLVRMAVARVLGKMAPHERDNELIQAALKELKSAK